MPPHSVSSTFCHNASPPVVIVRSTTVCTHEAILVQRVKALALPAKMY